MSLDTHIFFLKERFGGFVMMAHWIGIPVKYGPVMWGGWRSGFERSDDKDKTFPTFFMKLKAKRFSIKLTENA